MAEDYTKIERPFDDLLQREEDLPYVLGDDSSTTQADSNGAVEEQPVKDGGAMNDLWINNFIRSTNWKPKSLGFYMEGRTGYAEFSNVYIVGDITASTGTIGGFTIGADYIRDAANSMGIASTVTASDDVRFWAGDTYVNRATAPFRVTEAGLLTAVGITSLNMKSYTNFETATRFTQTTDGAATITFNTSGLRLETSATATSSSLNEWFTTQNVFNTSPTFTTSFEWGGIPSSGGVGFMGLGAMATFSGSGATFTGSHIGFEFQYQAGVWNLYATFNNGGTEQFSLLTTMATSDKFDLLLKVNGTSSVDYYYRKNSGTLTKTTLTGTVPSGVSNKVQFGISNKGSANNIICLVYCATYER